MQRRTRIKLWPIALFCNILGTVICAVASATTIQIPKDMDTTDRRQAVRILGFGTSSKILTDPYPLGGYSGFEVGVSMESLPVGELSHLGNRQSTPQQDVSYAKFTIGKGLYNNVDFFLQFIPFSEGKEISQYGGILRWGFIQGTSFPYSLSALVHTNSTNINNQVTTRTYGVDLIAGINVSNVALYAGGGPLQCRGRFNGGLSEAGNTNSGLTDSGVLETENVFGGHAMLGANVHMEPVFVSMQIDRYETTVYSAKLGMRF